MLRAGHHQSAASEWQSSNENTPRSQRGRAPAIPGRAQTSVCASIVQVRANNLQELVYKQGQAGVTKATVSITFVNEDKERSPVGYEHLDEITVTRQLVIGGKSKYLINGKVAEPS
jgi:hypothetical protein